MSEKHYRPIIKDGDHLVQSKKNSNRVIGQTRNAENKNPDIIEWEEVEDTDYEYELAKMAHEERMAEVHSRQSTADAITSVLNLINTTVTFLAENPEVLEVAVNLGKKAKNGIAGVKNKLILAVQDGKKQKKNRENIKNAASVPEFTDTKIAAPISTDAILDAMETSQSERENISVDEARELILGILMDYISMKKKLNRLTNANIDNIKRQELDVGEVIAQLDSLIKEYPALMDDSTTENIAALLRMNSDSQENKKIKEVLRID